MNAVGHASDPKTTLLRIGRSLGLGTDASPEAVEADIDVWFRCLASIARAVGEKDAFNPTAVLTAVETRMAILDTVAPSLPAAPAVLHSTSSEELRALEAKLEAQISAVRVVRALLKST